MFHKTILLPVLALLLCGSATANAQQRFPRPAVHFGPTGGQISSVSGIVLGAGGAGGGFACGTARTDFLVDPGTTGISAVWWTPTDNISDMIKFHNITVSVSGAGHDLIDLSCVGGGAPGLLNITLYFLH